LQHLRLFDDGFDHAAQEEVLRQFGGFGFGHGHGVCLLARYWLPATGYWLLAAGFGFSAPGYQAQALALAKAGREVVFPVPIANSQ
jgi:hypothetical protein